MSINATVAIALQNLSLFISYDCLDISALLKGLGHITVNKPVISRMYIVAHTWPLCYAQSFVDGVHPH